MQTARLCSRQTCQREATVTLQYSYADSTAIIGALSEFREPHAYDLCDDHAARLTAPQGWRVVYRYPSRVRTPPNPRIRTQEFKHPNAKNLP